MLLYVVSLRCSILLWPAHKWLSLTPALLFVLQFPDGIDLQSGSFKQVEIKDRGTHRNTEESSRWNYHELSCVNLCLLRSLRGIAIAALALHIKARS